MMAFSASICNLSNGLIGNMVGVFVNKVFVGVTENDMSRYYVLTLISLVSCLYELIIIRLIPIQSEID